MFQYSKITLTKEIHIFTDSALDSQIITHIHNNNFSTASQTKLIQLNTRRKIIYQVNQCLHHHHWSENRLCCHPEKHGN